MRRIVIIGATSGIGLELVRQYLANGDKVGGCGRSADILLQLKTACPESFYAATLDIRDTAILPGILERLISDMGGMDICILSSGISEGNRDLAWEIEENILQTNIIGYAAAAVFAANFFIRQGQGHLAGITSVAKYFGNYNPAYSASKAFGSIYLRGLRLSLARHGVHVTEIIPGFVRTPIIEGNKKVFWAAPVKKAARQIIRAIEQRRRTAYISKRWSLAGFVLPLIPFAVWKKIL
jgi:short-subunit dehydrogenase